MPEIRDSYQAARRFILQRARPLDCARFRFHFEDGNADEVLDLLAQYQNSDGGFGNAIEPDFWNPLSSPMQTWAATEIIQSLNYGNDDHPVIQGILRFLESTDHFDGHTWSRTIATNNDYPHAEWWAHELISERTYNPTAALAGFALQYSKVGSALHGLAKRISSEAIDALLASSSVEVHELSCYHRLLQCLTHLEADISEAEAFVDQHVNAAITRNTSTWATDYVCRPSRFIRNPKDRLFSENEEIVRYECQFLKETQQGDGSWPVNWRWSSYPDEWPVAQEWWKSIIAIDNLQFLSNVGELLEA